VPTTPVFSLNDNITLSDKFTQLRFVVGWTLEAGFDLLGVICVTVGSFDVQMSWKEVRSHIFSSDWGGSVLCEGRLWETTRLNFYKSIWKRK
jgi:hypothetical protein